MPKRIEIDGQIHEFPDDFTDEDIASALGGGAAPPPADPVSALDRLVNALPMIGGATGGILGGLSGLPTLGLGSGPGAVIGASALGAGGEALKQLINTYLGESTPDTMGESARDIALQAGIQGGSELAGLGVAKGLSKGAQMVYRGYLKPSLAAKHVGKAPGIVATALDEGLPISKGGVAKAQGVISSLNQQVDDLLQQSPGKVDLKHIADQVRAFAKRQFYKPGADLSDYQAVLAVADRIDAHPALGLPAGAMPSRIDAPLSGAQSVKRALQASARSSYGAPQAAAKKAGEKVGARATRLAIEGATGGPTGLVARLNAREAKLIDAARAITHAVEREANQNPIYGVKTLFSGALGTGGLAMGMGGPASAAGALATRAALHPPVATSIAIVANRIAKELGVGSASAARLAEYVLSEQQDADQ